MKVQELIDKLSKLNPEANVFIYNEEELFHMMIAKNNNYEDVYEDDEGDVIINVNR